MSNLKVAVRVRPMSHRELDFKSQTAVLIDNGVVSVTNMKVPEHHAGDSRKRIRKFAFDYCYNEEATQDEVFSMIEREVSTALSRRYNACVLAYGQSSTGKTYTMMGLQDEPGLTPRLCENIFKYFQSSVTEDEIKEMRTSVSYLEIYNERVQDLLTTQNKNLRVREHPKKGPYVQGLSEHLVSTPSELLQWLYSGNSNRRVGATCANRKSSRSHSLLTLSNAVSGGITRLHLVDLAGSERASHQAAHRLKEGANINRSLVALGNVICALAVQSSKHNRNPRKRFVPYRDSVLTWLLKETLGGNSKTVMIATVSPSSVCYSETVNTLRFGQRAKQIVNRPVVNEDPKEKLIRELRAEIQRLKTLLSQQTSFESDSGLAMSESLKSPEIIEGTDEESALSQTETDELESSDTLIEPTKQNPQEEIDKEENKSDDNKLKEYTKTEKLIPVIDITSSVKPKAKSTLSRTFSVDFSRSVIGNLKQEFGSHETLPNILQKRRPSFRESQENLDKKQENSSRSGSISESSGKSTPIKNPIHTRRVHRRSEVVAAVTQRLYSQTKKEDKSMETSAMLPRQNLCSSARMRLRELTQKALTASKRKVHSETQTEDQVTVRVKEKSTDVQDMDIALRKVKDANISAITPTQTVGVSCLVENYNKTIKLTRSCSSQTDEPKNQTVSFTQYLKNPPLAIHSYAQPIYTSSVNINVSHNYSSQKEDISDDSLEDMTQHIKYSTPDLISNHNSLEPTIQKVSKSTSTEEKPQKFVQNEYFATNSPEYCVANSSVVPQVAEKIQNISRPQVCATEIRQNNEFTESCAMLQEHTPPELVKSTQTYEPLKSKPKYVRHDIKKHNTHSSSDDSDSESSISYKKVRFSKRKDMMLDVIQNFMDEASSILHRLNSVAKQVEKSGEIRNRRTVVLKQKLEQDLKECYVQTYFPYHDASSQTSRLPTPIDVVTENKYEQILKTSCDRLEQCVKLAEHKKNVSDSLHKFPQPFCSDEWKCGEFSSLETTQSASDYGSLPRYRRSSPKAYMQQLIALRKQVVESSRQNLMEELKH